GALRGAAFLGESMSWAKVVAVALAFVGTVLVVRAQLTGAAPVGLILGLTSAAIYSAYILCGSRLLPGVPPVSATATIMTAAALVCTVVTTLSGPIVATWTTAR